LEEGALQFFATDLQTNDKVTVWRLKFRIADCHSHHRTRRELPAGGQRGFGADIANNAATTQGGLVGDADKKLADAYAGIFRAFIKHRALVKMVTFWGANDANSWRAQGKPLLFDSNGQPKLAFNAVIAEAKKLQQRDKR
jgi:hypothetical protein